LRFYRIADARFGPADGEGARLYGGRWNSPGRAVIYACETYSGAMLEKLVHTGGRMPRHQVCVVFEAPDALAVEVLAEEAIEGWRSQDLRVARLAGDSWLDRGRTAVLKVPSMVFPVEKNVVINPAHRDFRRIRTLGIEPVLWDQRLFSNAQ